MLVVLLAAGGCAGKSRTAAEVATTVAPTTTVTTTAAATATTPAPGGGMAMLRLVNLYALDASPPALDVYFGYDAGSGRTLVSGLAFGADTGYLPVTIPSARGLALTAYRQGRTAVADRLAFLSPQMRPGDVQTLVVEATGASVGGVAFFEVVTTPGQVAATLLPAGKALLLMSTHSMEKVLGLQGGPRFGIGHPGGACLSPYELSDLSVNDGAASTYAVDPGRLQLAVFPEPPPGPPGEAAPSPDCRGKPLAGPVTIDLAAGGRTLVLVYGTSLTDVRLLVLPLRATL